MTDLRKAAEMAFEIIGVLKPDNMEHKQLQGAAWDALRTALAQPEQEPVGYWQGEYSKDGGATLYEVKQESAFGRTYKNIPLYTKPDSATRSADSAESFCKQELHNLMSVAGRMALELECLLLDTENLSVVSKWWDTGMEALQAYRHYVWSVTHGKDGENFCDTHCVHTDHHPDCELAQPESDPVALKQLREVHEVQGLKGNWDFDPYMRGLYNGLELALSLFEKRDPVYKAPISEPVKGDISEPVENLDPVAWVDQIWIDRTDVAKQIPFDRMFSRCKLHDNQMPLYTAPPVKQWVGLTDEEISTIDWKHNETLHDYARTIEAKLKEKNT